MTVLNARRDSRQSAFSGEHSASLDTWPTRPDHRSSGDQLSPAQLLEYRARPDTVRPLDAATQQQRRLRMMRWTSVMRDGTSDGPLYGSSERPERNMRGRDQAVARTAAGTRRSFRA